MVPAAFVTIERLAPDAERQGRSARRCPRPRGTGTRGRTRFVEPRTRAERDARRDLGERAASSASAIEDNFFELGGDSILSIQIIVQARARPASPSRRATLQAPDHRGPRRHGAPAAGPVDDRQGPSSGAVPLTPVQRWFFEQRLAEPHHWNQAFLFQAPGDLDLERLQEALGRRGRAPRRVSAPIPQGRPLGAVLRAEPACSALERMDLRAVPPERAACRALESAGRALQERAATSKTGLSLEPLISPRARARRARCSSSSTT